MLKSENPMGREIRKGKGGLYKCLHFSIPSDLKKTTAVVESLSTTSTRCSVTEITSLLQDSTNRMRNLHQIPHPVLHSITPALHQAWRRVHIHIDLV